MGKHKFIETPDKLWELFEEYVNHERQNPLFKTEYVGKDGNTVYTPLAVPITFEGFECYLADIDYIQDLGDYAKNDDGRYTDYAPIITRIRKNCFVQNFKGASVGLFNPNIIARKLGLKDTVDDTGSKDVTIKVKYESKRIDDNP